MPPSLSLIIPAYNEEKYIGTTLQSILQQDHPDYEVIVVANGCTDQTEEIVRKTANGSTRLLSLPKANVSVARNAGALNAQGEILVFLDADTQLSPGSLQCIQQQFPGHGVGSVLVKPDLPKMKFFLAMMGKNLLMKSKIFKGFSGTLICRKKDFHMVGGYNPELSLQEHHDLRRRLEKQGTYTCISTWVTTSMRRFSRWSFSHTLAFWLGQWKSYYAHEKNKKEYEYIR